MVDHLIEVRRSQVNIVLAEYVDIFLNEIKPTNEQIEEFLDLCEYRAAKGGPIVIKYKIVD